MTLDRDTLAALRAHERRMAAERQPDWTHYGHVFITPRGRPYHQSEVLKAFHRACDRAGVERRRVHDLRVTSATMLRDLDVPEDVRMARLGHATKDMARHYAQANPGIDREAARRLGDALRMAE